MTESGTSHGAAVESDLRQLQAEVARLRVENARLLRLLALTADEARPSRPTQTAIFEAAPGSVHAGSAPAAKVAFYAAMFGARTDVYACVGRTLAQADQVECQPSGAAGGELWLCYYLPGTGAEQDRVAFDVSVRDGTLSLAVVEMPRGSVMLER